MYRDTSFSQFLRGNRFRYNLLLMVTSSETWEIQRVTSGRFQSVYNVMKTDRDGIGSVDIIVSSWNVNTPRVLQEYQLLYHSPCMELKNFCSVRHNICMGIF